MKTGSLVVCVDASGIPNWVKPLKKDKIYTVRDIKGNQRYHPQHGVKKIEGIAIYLDEIVNIFHAGLQDEIGYCSKRFRELDTPIEINIEEIIELQEV